MNKKKFTKLLALYLPYLVIGLAATNLGESWRLAEGKELGDKIVSLIDTLPAAFANPLPSLHPLDILVGICCGAGLRLAVYLKSKNAKKYRHGMEYGSARWGTPADIAPFMAPKFEDNIILTKTERLMMSNRPPDPKNARNKNVLVVGGSGSGKTRYFIKPNLLQCTSKSHPVSFVVTDPKGGLIQECGLALLKNGYKIRTMNTINFHKSMRYNPFAYIHEEKDILKLVTTLMTNTKGEGQGGDPFWDKAERLLLTSLIAYLHYEAPAEEQNFATLLEMLNTMQVSEEDEDYQNPVDLLFEDLAKKKPNSFAGRQYKLYKLAAGKTAKSILISCGARLSPFDIQEIRDATMYDELELDKLGDRKTALFLIMSDTDSTFNFLMDVGPLFGLFLQSFFIGITMRILSIVIFVIVYGRMIEIYMAVSLAPIPMATWGNHEQSHVGQNYLRSLFALGFQGFLILICVAIYAVLLQNVAISGDAINSIWSIVGYTILLCFSLFKTSSVAKSILGAH